MRTSGIEPEAGLAAKVIVRICTCRRKINSTYNPRTLRCSYGSIECSYKSHTLYRLSSDRDVRFVGGGDGWLWGLTPGFGGLFVGEIVCKCWEREGKGNLVGRVRQTKKRHLLYIDQIDLETLRWNRDTRCYLSSTTYSLLFILVGILEEEPRLLWEAFHVISRLAQSRRCGAHGACTGLVMKQDCRLLLFN